MLDDKWIESHSQVLGDQMGITQNRRSPNIPQNTTICTIGTPKKGTPILGNPQMNLKVGIVHPARLQPLKGMWTTRNLSIVGS